MDRVKGSVIMFFIKYLRSTKDSRVLNSLTEDDQRLIKETIFPSSWYPLETFWRILLAFYEVYGERNPQNAREWGRSFGFDSLTAIYTDLSAYIEQNTTSSSIEYFCIISKSFFSHTRLEPVTLDIDSKNVRLRITRTSKNPGERIFYFLLCGYLETLVGRAGGQHPSVEWKENPEADPDRIVFDVIWS